MPNRDRRVHRPQVLGGELRRDRVEDLGHAVAEALEHLGAEHWRDALGGLEIPIVLEQHEPVRVDRPVAGEEERHVDVARAKGRDRERPAPIERDERREADPVGGFEPEEAERPGRALGRPAERELGGVGLEVAERMQVELRRGPSGHREAVLVLCTRRLEGDDPMALEGVREGGGGGQGIR